MIKAFKTLLENNDSNMIETVYMYKGVTSQKFTREVTDPGLLRGMKDWKAKEVVVSTRQMVMLKDNTINRSDYFVEYKNVPR